MFVKLIFSAVVLVTTANVTPSSAVTGTADLALPRYRDSDTSANLANRVSCNGESCAMTITQRTTGFGCDTEIIFFLPNSPGLIYPPTHCTVSITGSLTPVGRESGRCALVSNLTIRFGSGVTSLFNGTFRARGALTASADTNVTSAHLEIDGGSQLQENPLGVGSIRATVFRVTLPSPGISNLCEPATNQGKEGYFAPISNGTITIAP